ILLSFLSSSPATSVLLSFPTRRSSDLTCVHLWFRSYIRLRRGCTVIHLACMEHITLLVLADPAEPELKMLRRLPESVTVVIGERSEEHTSELQSRVELGCRLLLAKKKQALLTPAPRAVNERTTTAKKRVAQTPGAALHRPQPPGRRRRGGRGADLTTGGRRTAGTR